MTLQPAPLLLRERAETLAGPLPALLIGARNLMETALPGAHGRRRAGTGDEFWQFRPAQPSEGVNQVDWRRSGRGDDLFVREREWQAARAASLWVDPGAALGFASAKGLPTKAARAALLAMAVALLLLRGGERVALAIPGQTPRGGRQQAARLAQQLCAPTDGTEHGTPDLSGAPVGSQAVLFSDFLGDLDTLRFALDHAARHNIRAVLVQVLDPAEEGFPFDGRTRFESMSGHLHHETLRAGDLRADYLARLAARKDELARLTRQTGGVFGTFHTDRPASEALLWLAGALGGGRA